jgi:putative transposase
MDREATIKRPKCSEAQEAFSLRQLDESATVREVWRKAELPDATFFVWRKKHAGSMPSEMNRLWEIEDQNARLERIMADLSLDKEMLQDVIKRPAGQESQSSKICPAAPSRGLTASGLAGQHPALLQ